VSKIALGDDRTVKKEEALRRLEELWNEAHPLAERGRVSHEDVDRWRAKTNDALKEIYGEGSRKHNEFLEIRFEQNPKLLDLARRLLPEHLAAAGLDPETAKIDLNVERHYAKRLTEAAELLLTFITELR
jgi:hypothetical protein